MVEGPWPRPNITGNCTASYPTTASRRSPSPFRGGMARFWTWLCVARMAHGAKTVRKPPKGSDSPPEIGPAGVFVQRAQRRITLCALSREWPRDKGALGSAASRSISIPMPLIVAAALFVVLAIAEYLRPDRPARIGRWPRNIGWWAATLVATRIVGFAAPLAAAIWAERQGFGVMQHLAVPAWGAAIITIIVMDCAVYWQHRGFHRINWLWRWHRLHHDDTGLDVTTGIRFHPIEGLISLLWKSACIILLGAPPWVVPLFELWLSAGSLIEHSNIRLAPVLDRIVRSAIVTPAMHRVHHSAHGDDAQHNFGFAIAVWDRLFGTWRLAPQGQEIGLPREPAL